ncbi:MAG TPA: RDD family protein [Bryobacteraceae bacterium]
MIHCSSCGAEAGELAAFCPNCGTALAQLSSASPVARVLPVPVTRAGEREETGRRVLAFLIDIVPMLLLSLVHFVPIFGWMFYGLLHALYWLLRDVNGASPGKAILGSFVANAVGGPSTNSQRILRNLPLAIPGFLGLIPLAGVIFEFFAAIIIFGGEALLLLTTGRRFGDRLAGTTVVRR